VTHSVMMNRALVSATAFILLAIGPAVAADMSFNAPPPVSIYNWGGFYVGAHVGADWDTVDWIEDAATSASGGVAGVGFHDAGVRASGVLGGGQIGFNYQTNWFVFGMQADISGADIEGSAPCFSEVVGTAQTCSTKVNALGTVTARLGASYHNALFYVLGGIAGADERLQNLCNVCGPLGTPTNAVFSSTRGGYTVGAGVEYAFAGAWSGFLQYNFVTLGTRDLTFSNQPPNIPVPGFFSENIRENLNIIRAGINYRFIWGPS
jgi:outer membrane immunogenic protein